jgi:hypothetical protein
MSAKAFSLTAYYDSVVSNWLNDKFDINFNFYNSKVALQPLENTFLVNTKGKISNETININGNFGKENLTFKGFDIKNIQGNFKLKDKKFSLSVFARNSKEVNNFFASLNVNIDLANKLLNSRFSLNGEKKGYQFAISGKTKGDIKKFGGIINYAVLRKDSFVVSNDSLNLNVNTEKGIYAKLFKEKIYLNFKPKIKLHLKNPQIELFVKNSEKSLYFFSPSVKIYKSKVEILNLTGVLAKIDNEKLTAYPFFYSGIFKGHIKTLKYWFSDKKLQINTKGRLDKQVISQIIPILSVDGDAIYSLSYNGEIKDFISKADLKIQSNNLKLKSSYVIGVLKVKDLLAYLKDGYINVKVFAENNLALFSKGKVDLYAVSNIKEKEVYVYSEISNLPVKYLSLFKGNVNSNLKVKLKNLQGKIEGQVSLAGNLKLDLSSFKKKSKGESPKNLEKIKLNIKISSYLPIYVYGDWGEAYAEIKGELTGSLASPVFNGEIIIIYGKVAYMKNRFNIDFANIKISNNIPFLTARLSTTVANTHIFINISGNILGS